MAMSECAKCGKGHPRCQGHNNRGGPCMCWPTKGSANCTIHQGGPAARAVVALRALEAEVSKTLGFEPISEVEPISNVVEYILRNIAQSSIRAEGYAGEIRRLVAESPSLERALVGDTIGEFGKVGEYIRGIAQLENAERDRGMGWAFKAAAVGIEAKRVEMAAAAGTQIAAVLAAVRAHPALALSEAQRAVFGSVVREVLGLSAGGGTVEAEGG